MAWRVGIDENGLGPQLGPLLVTAALARCSSQAEKQLESSPQSFLHDRLNDSKKLVDHHHVSLGEAWARLACEQMHSPPQTPEQLVSELSLWDQHRLRELCPGRAAKQCWDAEGDRFEATDEELAAVRADLRCLASKGIDLQWVASAIVCTRRINLARRAGHGRFDVDLHTMEELVLASRERAGEPILAICGKVGGLRRYVPALGVLAGRLHLGLEETANRSCYRFPGLGEVRFVRDADGCDPLVALASLVGQYLRQLLMRRIVQHYKRADSQLQDASGYNDPITNRFVQATQPLRKRWRIPDSCFLRAQASSRSEPL